MKKNDSIIKSKKLMKDKVLTTLTPIISAQEPGKPGRKKKGGEHYVDSAVFSEQILKCHNDNIISQELGKSVYDIATRLSFAPNFINYSFKEDMIGDAIIKMITALKNKRFNPKKGNAFSYYTMIAFHAFCNRIKKESKARDALFNHQQEVYDAYTTSGLFSESGNEDIDE